MSHTISQDRCVRCKVCMEVCPNRLIGEGPDGMMYFISEKVGICLKCGQCMAVCKTMAISVDPFRYGKELVDMPSSSTDFPDFMNFLAGRRSVRQFKKKEVPDELIERILNSVSYAPYGAAPEKVNITVVNNRETIESALPAIEAFLNDIVKWMENPVASFMIRQKKGRETFQTLKNHVYPISKAGNYQLKEGDHITRDAPVLLLFHADIEAEEHSHNALIYASYVMLAAHAAGLGATMIGLVPAAINKLDGLKEYFRIPKGNEVVISLILGFPKIKYHRTIQRSLPPIVWLR